MSVWSSYRNQSTDLRSKSIDWFHMTATLAFNGLMKRTKLVFFMKNYPIEAQIVFVDEDSLGRHTWLVHFVNRGAF